MTTVKINEELSNYIERLHYDYNVSMNILKYLSNYVENPESKLQDFFTQTKNIGNWTHEIHILFNHSRKTL